MGLPLVCDLNALDSGEMARRQDLQDLLASGITSYRELDRGFVFDLGPDLLDTATEFASLESRCCQFLSIEVRDLPHPQLIITGPEGVKPFIGAELGFTTAP